MTRRAWILWSGAWLLFAFLQAPGLTVADTKHNLTANPWGFLAQATAPWTDVFPLGQMQNQAYGYLFPQGLFFALLSWLPDWVTQRLWWALLLMLAFAGMVKLLECAGVGSRGSRVVAGVLFALSPRILTTLGAISSEAWVVALAPWVLVPVVCMTTSTRPFHLRLLALASAVAVLGLGAVNAVATAIAVLPAVVWWVACVLRSSTRQRAVRFGIWWVPAGLLAVFWWVGPLLLLGKYSPPFTDYIESSSLTTRWLNLIEVLRGTTSWTPFLSTERVGGYALATEPVFVVATLIVALVGLWGLAQRSLPFAGRWWAIFGIGLVAMVAAAEPFSPIAGAYREFLDGAGAALRNLHKFDPLVRMALLAGVAHALRRIEWPGFSRQRWAAWRNPEKNPTVVKAIAVSLLMAVVTAPGWSGRIAPEDGFTSVPSYWQEAADWLNSNAAGVDDAEHQVARTMILPEARFARQTWGNTRDEPAQPLLDVPWVVRDSVPLVQPEAIRGLDGLQRELDNGEAAPALAGTLWNQGVGQLLIRTDLTTASDTPGARNILRTLERSEGFHEVAQFGEGEGAQGREPAIRIFAVEPPQLRDAAPQGSTAGDLRIIEAEQVETVAAGPETMARLDAADQALGRTTLPRTRVLSGENDREGHEVASNHAQTVTDDPALRDHNYGNVTNADSDVREAEDKSSILNPVTDYPVRGVGEQTAVQQDKGRIVASSTASDPTGFNGADTTSGLTAAVDGQADTAWRPTRGNTAGEWLEVQTSGWHNRLYVEVRTQGALARVQVSSLLREEGSDPHSDEDTDEAIRTSTTVSASQGQPVKQALPVGQANAVRITILSAFGDFGISEIKVVDGLTGEDYTPTRVVTVPEPEGEGQHTNRWVFGQEIPETVMTRAFTIPERPGGMGTTPTGATRLLVVASHCEGRKSGITIDGEDYSCGDTLELDPGQHTLTSAARWVSLTAAEPLYGEAVRQAASAQPLPTEGSGGDARLDGDRYRIEDSTEDRIVFTASDTNPGRVGTITAQDGSTVALQPVTVNGWQQGWLVPAGVAGTFHTHFEATAFYQGWLVIGLGCALLLLGAFLFLFARHRGDISAARRHRDRELRSLRARLEQEPTPRQTRWSVLRISTWGLFGFFGLGVVLAAQGNWGSPHYAGDSWWANGAFAVALLCAITTAFVSRHQELMKRRAGSSTRE